MVSSSFLSWCEKSSLTSSSSQSSSHCRPTSFTCSSFSTQSAQETKQETMFVRYESDSLFYFSNQGPLQTTRLSLLIDPPIQNFNLSLQFGIRIFFIITKIIRWINKNKKKNEIEIHLGWFQTPRTHHRPRTDPSLLLLSSPSALPPYVQIGKLLLNRRWKEEP